MIDMFIVLYYGVFNIYFLHGEMLHMTYVFSFTLYIYIYCHWLSWLYLLGRLEDVWFIPNTTINGLDSNHPQMLGIS